MDLELKGKVAIVTGGNRGIGKAIGRVLAQEGANVALIARNPATLETAAAEISKAGGGKAKGFVCDTTDDAAVKKMVADVVAGSAGWTSWSTAPPSRAGRRGRPRWPKSRPRRSGTTSIPRWSATCAPRARWRRT